MIRRSLIYRIIGIILILSIGTALLPFTQAQDNNPTVITVTGTVEAVVGTTVVVSGVTVDVSSANVVISNLPLGTVVQVTGSMNNGTIVATTIIVITATATPLPEATETPEMTETPEATETPEMTETAVPESTESPDTEVIIIIEGPVQKITVNVITILDIDIEVDPGDAILTKIHIGDKIRVEGKAKARGTTIIIVAVNITIINVIVVNPPPQQGNPGLPPGCKISKNGKIKCSKKHK